MITIRTSGVNGTSGGLLDFWTFSLLVTSVFHAFLYFTVSVCLCLSLSLSLSLSLCPSISVFVCADFSPSGSPLNVLFPPPRDCFGELDPLPVWDWGTTWVEEMEAQYRAGRTGGAAAKVMNSLSSVPDRWGYHRQDARQADNKMPSHR